jgi:hypothetical protein
MTAPATSRREPPAPATQTRTIGWVPVILVALLPVFLLVGRGYQIGDPDTFWHIRAGDYLRQSWQFSGPDPWSPFTAKPWVLHEWVPELAMSVANQVGGLGGVAWLWYAASVGVAVCLYAACRREGPPVIAALGTVLGLLGMWASLSPRPQLATFAFTALVTAAWLASARDGRRRWWLLPLTWVWASTHGMWFVGPMLGIVVVAGMALDPRRRAVAGRLLPVPLSSVAVAALTPAGPALLTSPLAVAGYTWFVSEWDPPRLSSPPVAATLLLLAVVAVVWARGSTRPDFARIAVWLLALGWTLAYTRTVAVGAAIAAPLFVGVVSGALRGRVLAAESQARRISTDIVAASVSTVLSLLLALVLVPASARTAVGMPSSLDGELDRLPVGTVVVNEYGFGGWLRYAHPDLVPVIDERTELYAEDYLEEYLGARAARVGWQQFLARTGATAALVPTASALGDALQYEAGWRAVASREGFVLLVARGP